VNKNLLVIAIGLLAGGIALAIGLFNRAPAPIQTPAADPALHFDQSVGTEQRILALEAAVAEERNARMLLEEELQALYAALDEIAGANAGDVENDVFGQAQADVRDIRQLRSAADADWRRSQLVEAGFSVDRAEWILKRESELEMEAMRTVYEFRRTGERPENFEQVMDTEAGLRADIGDSEYEQYLQAYGRPTAVAVGTVLESSPGQRAGLQPGDQITSYAGQRVFNYTDLHAQTLAAEPGQPVVVDIVRDGIAMQVVVEGGPIGISNTRFGRLGRR
jgi:membrane-associated protease RseP (regulator of RpoE activity)